MLRKGYFVTFAFLLSQRKRQKTASQAEPSGFQPVEYPSLDDYHEIGLENFTSEDVRQLHEVSEPVPESRAERDFHQSNLQDFVPVFKAQLQERDFDLKFAEMVCSQRKRYSTTDKTIFGLAKEWLDFYREAFHSGKNQNQLASQE